jgi:hypothetical protein
LYFAEAQFETVGLTMSIVRRMIADITVYVAVMCVFLIAFTHAMTIAFRGKVPPNENFGTPSASFSTLGFFIFNFDPSSVYEESDRDRRSVAMILLAIYESLVVVVFLNLVIAVMTTSFEDIMSNARTEWLLVRAKICVRMEDQTSAGLCTTRIKRHIRKLRSKRTAIVMERASGENEVSLPISLLPPPLHVSVLFSKWMRTIRKRLGYQIESEEELLNGTLDAPTSYGTLPAVPSPVRKVKRQSSESVVDVITGQSEEVFCVGKFTRYSVAHGHHSVASGGGPAATPVVANPIPMAPDPLLNASSIGDPTILGDDDLLRSLKLIVQELERRGSQKANA